MRTARFLILALASLLPLAPAAAQSGAAAEGVLHVVDWPREQSRALRHYELLPSIDTLTVGYRYEMQGDEPLLSLALEWKPGAWGVLDGERVPLATFPDSLVMASVAVRAQVYSRGRRAAEVILHADTLGLEPSPAVSQERDRPLAWKAVFVDASPRAARKIMERGFELRDPELIAVAFESFDEETGREVAARVRIGRPVPRRRTVYGPPFPSGVLIDLGWLLSGRSWDDGPEPTSTGPRGREMGRDGGEEDSGSGRGSESEGRGGRTRSGDASAPAVEEKESDGAAEAVGRVFGRKKSSDGEKNSDDDEEDDDAKLLPVALTAAAAVGVLAYKAGTVGYYGNAEFAPIGVSAGYVRRAGGVLIQAAANQAALGSGTGPEHLLAKALAFQRLLPIPVQPALGLGVAVEERGDAFEYRPSLSAGAVGNFGPVVVLGAYDFTVGGWELGAAFNFRSRQ